jgi:hypothetical protein
MPNSSTSLRSARDAVQIANQQDAKQQFGIHRGPPRITVAVPKLFANETEIDVLIDEPQQVILGNILIQSEVVEQCF